MPNPQDPPQQPQQPQRSKRDDFSDRFRKKHPDQQQLPDNDDDLYAQLASDYDDYDSQIADYRSREDKLSSLLAENPMSAPFIADMAEGKDPWIALIERLGIDGITDIINDPEKQKEYAEANKRHVEQAAKSKQLDEEFNKNLPASLDLLDRVQKEKGLPDETMDKAFDLIQRIFNEALVGKYSEETINLALKAVSHDADIADARQQGEVAGRNFKIEERLRSASQGDGTPNLPGNNNAPRRRPSSSSMFDLADQAR